MKCVRSGVTRAASRLLWGIPVLLVNTDGARVGGGNGRAVVSAMAVVVGAMGVEGV